MQQGLEIASKDTTATTSLNHDNKATSQHIIMKDILNLNILYKSMNRHETEIQIYENVGMGAFIIVHTPPEWATCQKSCPEKWYTTYYQGPLGVPKNAFGQI